jgi:hypothetical protein
MTNAGKKNNKKNPKRYHWLAYNILALRDQERGFGPPAPLHRKICQYKVEMSHFETGTNFENQK